MYKGAGHKGTWDAGKGQSWNYNMKGNQFARARKVRTTVPRMEARDGMGHEKGGTRDSRLCWNCATKGHIATLSPKNWSNGLYALDEGDEGILEELHEISDSCTHGVCWKKVRVNSGRRSSASSSHRTLERGQRTASVSPVSV